MQTPLEQIHQLIRSRSSVIISSIEKESVPHTSYAPFVMVEERFYVFISDAARHTRNLIQHAACSLLFIEDEAESSQIFARRRVSLECEASEVSRDHPLYETALSHLQERFGEIVAMLSTMQDFRLMVLEPLSGEAVFGFGEAYIIEQPFDTVTPKRVGHTHRKK